jgi:hypothetical protein
VAASFLKQGPLAWNGLFVWWIPFVAFTAWFGVMIALTRKAVLLGDGRLGLGDGDEGGCAGPAD